MPTNLYDKPANYQFINTYVPYTDVAQMLYKTGAGRQAKADENRKAAQEAAKKAGDKLSWYDQYANENNVKGIISQRLSDVNNTVDPSSSEYGYKVNEVINDPSIRTFYSISESQKAAADKYKDVGSTGEYKEGTNWQRVKADSMVNNLNAASTKEQFGGTGYILNNYGDTGLVTPQFTKAKDLGQQIIDDANKLNPNGYTYVNGGLYAKTESGLQEVTKDRIAQIGGFKRTKDGSWDFNSPEEMNAFLNTDAGITTWDNAKYKAFGENEYITGDPNFDRKIEDAIHSSPEDKDKPIEFIDYETGQKITKTAGEIKGEFYEQFNGEVDYALNKAYAEAYKDVTSKSEVTQLAMDIAKEKLDAGKTPLIIPTPTVPIDGKDVAKGLVGAMAVSQSSKGILANASLDIIKEVYGQEVANSYLRKGEDAIIQFGNQLMANHQGTISQDRQTVYADAYNGYQSAVTNQRDYEGQVQTAYSDFSGTLDAETKQEAYDNLKGKIAGVNANNADKYLLAIYSPEKYWRYAFKSEEEAILAAQQVQKAGPNNLSVLATNIEDEFLGYMKDNKVQITTGDYIYHAQDGTSEQKMTEEMSKVFAKNPNLFLDQRTVDGLTVAEKLTSILEDKDINSLDLFGGGYKLQTTFTHNPLKPGTSNIMYSFVPTSNNSDGTAKETIVISDVKPKAGSNIADLMTDFMIDELKAAEVNYSNSPNEPRTKQAVYDSYERLGAHQNNTELNNNFKTGTSGVNVNTQFGNQYKVKSIEKTGGGVYYEMYQIIGGQPYKISKEDIKSATGNDIITGTSDIQKIIGKEYEEYLLKGTPGNTIIPTQDMTPVKKIK